MSGTFVAPATATTGLQPYDLEGATKNTYAARRAKRKRVEMTSAHNMRKGQHMDAFEAMTATLSKSVGDLITAAPENLPELLEKNFTEFNEVLEQQVSSEIAAAVDDATKDNVVEEPLFKGLGCVGRVANMFSMLVSQAEMIKNGLEYRHQDESKAHDPASEDISTLLDHMIALGELTLRAAVNEHCDVADDEEYEDGFHYVAVPSGEDPDDEEQDVVVKTMLPEDLAKFATDPGIIGQTVVELGAGLMLDGGVPQEHLEKLFFGGDLAKNFPPKKSSSDGAGPASNAAPGEHADPNSSPGDSGDPVNDDAAQTDMTGAAGDAAGAQDDGSQDDPFTMLGRILAAAMIQLDAIQQMMSGDDGSGEDDGSMNATDPEGAAPAAGAGPAPAHAQKPPFAKAAKADGLEKAADVAAMSDMEVLLATIDNLNKRVAHFEKQPAPAKGIANPALTLSKAADTGGVPVEDELQKEAARIASLPQDMQGEERAVLLAKRAFQNPLKVTGDIGALTDWQRQ